MRPALLSTQVLTDLDPTRVVSQLNPSVQVVVNPAVMEARLLTYDEPAHRTDPRIARSMPLLMKSVAPAPVIGLGVNRSPGPAAMPP